MRVHAHMRPLGRTDGPLGCRAECVHVARRHIVTDTQGFALQQACARGARSMAGTKNDRVRGVGQVRLGSRHSDALRPIALTECCSCRRLVRGSTVMRCSLRSSGRWTRTTRERCACDRELRAAPYFLSMLTSSVLYRSDVPSWWPLCRLLPLVLHRWTWPSLWGSSRQRVRRTPRGTWR